jgi:hypothetical protein
LWAKRLTASTIFAAGRSKATDRLDASLGNFLRLQLNDSVAAVPILRSLVHPSILFLDIRRDLDDFKYARQVARRVEVDDADAAWRYVGKRL